MLQRPGSQEPSLYHAQRFYPIDTLSGSSPYSLCLLPPPHPPSPPPPPGDQPQQPQPQPPDITESKYSEQLQELQQRLREAQIALQQSEERQRALAPYRVSAPRRGIIGNSRYANNLRKQIVAASRDNRRTPVLIFGEPGLQKNNIAALIHFGSPFSQAPLVQIDCDRLDDDASELIGRGAKKGLLYWLPNDATLILNNIHKAPPSVMPILTREVTTASVAASMDDMDIEMILGTGTGSGTDPMTSTPEWDDERMTERDVLTAAGTSAKRRVPVCRFPRIIMTAEKRVPELEELSTVVKVPPLRVRPEDIDDLAIYLLRTISRQRDLGPVTLTPEALRQLESGQYPNNVAELTAAVERAVAQSVRYGSANSNTVVSYDDKNASERKKKGITIGEEVFWFASQPTSRLRLDLLKSLPLFRKLARSEWWPDKINYGFTVYAFAVMNIILIFGPQDRDHNFCLSLFWNYWWPLSFIIYPFLGRIWCAYCPFMIYGTLVENFRKATGAKLLKWPREAMDKYGAWFLFWLFAGILVWEEVWDLPQTAYLSSYLLLLITAGAMICSTFFERRLWCRHLCPIGGLNGMFAKLSMTELRARQGVCSAQCDTYTCYKGGPAVPPEGQESVGCPVYSHPAQLADNRNCVLCFECLRACPHRSIEFRLRVPGADIFDHTHVPLQAEMCLMYMMLGNVYLKNLAPLLQEFGIDPGTVTHDRLTYIVVSCIVLAVPGCIAFGVDQGWRALASFLSTPSPAMKPIPVMSSSSSGGGGGSEDTARAMAILQAASSSYTSQQANSVIQPPAKPFLDLSYGYLPMVWATTLAYYLRYGITEAGRILPVTALTFGIDPAPQWLPVVEAPEDVVKFLQGVVLLGGAALSLGMVRRVAQQPWKTVLPQCGLVIAFTAGIWHLILP